MLFDLFQLFDLCCYFRVRMEIGPMSPADYHSPHLPPQLQYLPFPRGDSPTSFVSPRKRYLRDFDPAPAGTNGGGPSPAKHRRLSTDQSQQRLGSTDQSQPRLGSTDSSLGGGGGSDRSSPYRTATPASPYRPSPLSPHQLAAASSSSPRPPKAASGSAFSSFSIDSLMSQSGGPSSPRQAAPSSPSRPQPIKRETGTTLYVPVAVKREENSGNSLPSPHHASLRHESTASFGSSPSRLVPSSSAHSPFLSSSRPSGTPPPSTPSFPSFSPYPGYHPLLAAHQAAAAAALLDPRMAAQLAASYPFPGLFHHSPFAASPFHHLSGGPFGGGPQQQPQPTPMVWTPPVATPTPPPQRTPLKNEPPPSPPPLILKSGHTMGSAYAAEVAAPPVDLSRSREGADGRPTYGRPDTTAQCRPQPTHQQVKTAAAGNSADGETLKVLE